MWHVRTKKDGIIKAPFISWRNNGTVLHLQSNYRKKTSWEVRDWKKLWLKEKTITETEDVRYAYYLLPIEQLISAQWIDEVEKEKT